MSEAFDIGTLFREMTGREMTGSDAERLRQLRRALPDPAAHSPSLMADIILMENARACLNESIERASSTITGNVQAQSERAVAHLVDESVKRIHSSSPDTSRAYIKVFILFQIWTAIVAATLWLVISAAMTLGYLIPPYLSEEASQKVAFANAVEDRIGLGSVDWLRREGRVDPSLMGILESLEHQDTAQDPVRQLSEFRACRGPGMVPYGSPGRTRCRFDVVE